MKGNFVLKRHLCSLLFRVMLWGPQTAFSIEQTTVYREKKPHHSEHLLCVSPSLTVYNAPSLRCEMDGPVARLMTGALLHAFKIVWMCPALCQYDCWNFRKGTFSLLWYTCVLCQSETPRARDLAAGFCSRVAHVACGSRRAAQPAEGRCLQCINTYQ